MDRLLAKDEDGIKWWIHLSTSSNESALVVINHLNDFKLRGLDIEVTPLDSDCTTALSKKLIALMNL